MCYILSCHSINDLQKSRKTDDLQKSSFDPTDPGGSLSLSSIIDGVQPLLAPMIDRMKNILDVVEEIESSVQTGVKEVADHLSIAKTVADKGLDLMTKIQPVIQQVLSDVKVDNIIEIFPAIITKFLSCFKSKTSTLGLSSILSPLGNFPSEIDIPFCLVENVVGDLASLIKVDVITNMISLLKNMAGRSSPYIQTLKNKIHTFLTSPPGFIEEGPSCSNDELIKFDTAVNFFRLFKSSLMCIVNWVSTVLEAVIAMVDLFASPIDAKFHTTLFIDVGVTKPEFMAQILSSILKIKDPIGDSFDVIVDLSVWIKDVTCQSSQINSANQFNQMVNNYLASEKSKAA